MSSVQVTVFPKGDAEGQVTGSQIGLVSLPIRSGSVVIQSNDPAGLRQLAEVLDEVATDLELSLLEHEQVPA